jgi:Replication-relaxation
MPSTATIEARLKGYSSKWRSTRARPMQFTERDIQILSAVYRFRVLHRQQIGELFFMDASREGASARRRLNLLYQNGYIERIPRFPKPPMMNPGPAYRLAARGATILAEHEGVKFQDFNYWGKNEDKHHHLTKLSHSHLEHGLLLSEIRIVFERLCADKRYEIVTWLDDFDLRPSWKTERVNIALPNRLEEVAIAPDGYFVLATEKGRGHFFIEVDRGTETIGRGWQRKILAYKAYLRSGLFHQTYGVDPRAGFRVLVFAPAAIRAKNLHTASQRYGSPETASVFLMTETPRFLTSALDAAIWLRDGFTGAQALL